jgi:hypothetical protein
MNPGPINWMQLRHPSEFWNAYHKGVELSPEAERVIRLAFHAGILAAFEAIDDLFEATDNLSDNSPKRTQIFDTFQWFRRQNEMVIQNL